MADFPKVALNLVFIKPDVIVQVAQRAEALGFESVWMGEHVALPHGDGWWKGYPGLPVEVRDAPEGEALMTFRPENLWLDPLTTFAHLAAATTTLRFGVGIFLLPLRNSVLLGRTLATLDVLSNGRIDLGVGIGWSKAEYDHTENDWRMRGRRMDESIACLRALFDPRDDFPEYHGKIFDVPRIGFLPKPKQDPFPIHVGGYGDAAVRRAASVGNGYYGSVALMPAVRQALKDAGREGEAFEFTATLPMQDDAAANLEGLRDYARKGVDRAIVAPWRRHTPIGIEAIDLLEDYARQIQLAPN